MVLGLSRPAPHALIWSQTSHPSNSLYLIRLDPAPLDGDPVITPFAQLGEIVLGGNAGVHDDRGLVLTLILRGKAVQRVEKRTGFADIARQNTGWRGKPPSSVARARVTRGQRFVSAWNVRIWPVRRPVVRSCACWSDQEDRGRQCRTASLAGKQAS